MTKHAEAARRSCPTLRDKQGPPRVLRHTCAMHLLQAGVDTSVIALWLGHEGVETARQPVGFFQVRVQPLEPPVARDSESTRLAILAGVRYMIDHAPARSRRKLQLEYSGFGIVFKRLLANAQRHFGSAPQHHPDAIRVVLPDTTPPSPRNSPGL